MVATSAIGAAQEEASPDYRLAYLDAERRDAVALLDANERVHLTWRTRDFGDSAAFSIDRASIPRIELTGKAEEAGIRVPRNGGDIQELRYVPGRWTLTVTSASLPDPRGRTFTMTFVIERPTPQAPWTIRLSSTGWWDGRDDLTFGRMLLNTFLAHDPNAPALTGLLAEIPERRAGPVLKGLFGPRIEGRGSLRLQLNRDFTWRLEPKDRATGEFYILHVFLTFRRLDVRRLFREGEDRATGAMRDTLLFDAEAPPGAGRGTTLGLYGTVGGIKAEDAFPILERPQGRAPVLGFVAGSRDGAGNSVAVRVRFDDAVPPRLAAELQARLRHWGDPERTVAGCILQANRKGRIGTVAVVTREAGTERTDAAFEVADMEIVRQGEPGRPVRTRLRFAPVAEDHRVATSLGVYDVAALPPLSPRPGSPGRVEPIEIVTADTGGDRTLRRFSARLALTHAAIPLPERHDEADPGSPRRQRHTSRLDFDAAEAFFHIPLVETPHPGSADAVVPLGLPGPVPSHGELALDRARLTVIRPDDLLALKFRFADLVLTLPWRGAGGPQARLAPRGGRSPARAAQPDAGERPIPSRDGRPLLAVEFPPQHVLEQAIFRQLPEPVTLPELVPAKDAEAFAAHLALLGRPKRWRGLPVDGTLASQRIEARKALQALNDVSGERAAVKTLIERFAEEAAARTLPKEQRLYAGPAFLDPDARRLAEAIWRDLVRPPVEPEPLWPDVTLPRDVRQRVLREAGLSKPEELCKPDRDLDLPAQDAILREKDRRDAGFVAFRHAYHRRYEALVAGDTAQKPDPAAADYRGREWLTRNKVLLGPDLLQFVRDSISPAGRIPLPAEARLSGPSRIVFRINPDDHEGERAGGAIPFSLEGLTNWASMDMAVVRRAERLMALPLSGRLPPRWQREVLADDAAILTFQGFTRADRPTRAADAKDLGRENRDVSRVSTTERLAEVYEASRHEPGPFETALELPARLHLSPAQTATWKTPSAAVQRAIAPAGAAGAEVRPLWTASLVDVGEDAGVRAVWSPDFRPAALLSADGPGSPPRGPWKPWAIRRGLGTRSDLAELEGQRFLTGLDAYDRHEVVALSSVHGLPVAGRWKAGGGLDTKGSQIEPPPGFRLRDIERTTGDGQLAGEDLRDWTAIYQPRPLSVTELSLSALGGSINLDTTFVPPAAARTKAGNLFDAFSVERWRQRTVLGRDVVVEVVYKGFLFPLGHTASLVKLTERLIVDAGDGAPTAVLIQRKFLKVADPVKTYPAEGQPNRSRRWSCQELEILTLTTPDLVDPAAELGGTADCPGGPLEVEDVLASGRLTFTGPGATGLCFWPRIAGRDGAEVWFEMRVAGEAVPLRLPLLFVDNQAANDPATVGAVVRYYNDRVPEDGAKAGTGPVRYLDRRGQPVRMAPETTPGDTTYETAWWSVKAEGRESPAPRTGDPDTPQNDHYVRSPLMIGRDQPPFYPLVAAASCRLTQAERLSGSGPIWRTVAYDPFYVRAGFGEDNPIAGGETKNVPEAFLIVRDEVHKLEFAGRGNLAGGVAHPNMNIVALSRRYGPLSVNAAPPRAAPLPPGETAPEARPVATSYLTANDGKSPFDAGNPLKAILPDDARLLGLVSLADLLKVAVGQIANRHPELREVVDYGSRTLREGAREARALLRDTVIQPLKDIITAVEAKWAEIAARQAGDGSTTASLGKAFPQIGEAIGALRGSLEKCLNAGTSDAEFMANLAATQAAGQRLIRTLDAIAQDPLASMSDQQLGIIRELKSRFDAVLALVRGLTKDLKSLPGLLLGRLVAPLVAEAGVAVRRFLVTVPIPAEAESLRAKVSVQVDLAVRGALAEALCVGAVANPCTVPVDTLGARLTALPVSITTKLEAAAKDLDDDPDLKDALKRLVTRLADTQLPAAIGPIKDALSGFDPGGALDKELETLRGRLEERFITPAVAPLLQALGAGTLSAAPARIEELARMLSGDALLKDPAAFLRELGAFLPPVATLLAKLDESARIGEIGAACAALRQGLSRAADAVLPSADDIDRLAGCIVRLKTSTGSGTCTVTASATFSSAALAALTTLQEAEQAASGSDQEAIKRARDALFATAGALADALAGLADVRRELSALLAGGQTGCVVSGADLPAAMRRLAGAQKLLVLAVMAFGRQAAQAREALESMLLAAADQTAKRKAGEAIAALLDLAAGGVRTVAAVTAVKAPDALAGVQAALKEAGDALEPQLPAVAGELKAAAGQIGEAIPLARTGQDDLKDLANRLDAAADRIRTAQPAALADAAQAAKTVLDGVAARIESLRRTVLAVIEQAALDLLTRLAAQGEARLQDALKGIVTALQAPLDGLVAFYAAVTVRRTEIAAAVAKVRAETPLVDTLLRSLETQLGVDDLFVVHDTVGGAKQDRLAREQDLVKQARDAAKDGKAVAVFAALDGLGQIWAAPALVELVERFGRIDASQLRVALVRALDLRAFRHEIESRIRELIPTRARLSYDLGGELDEFPKGGNPFLKPEGDSRLAIQTLAEVDLLDAATPAKVTVTGSVGPFKINLIPGIFEAVTIGFRGLTFTAGTGRSPDFDVRFGRTEIGKDAKFLDDLQAYLSPRGGGLKVGLLAEEPGIEAAYGVNLGSFGVGTLSFSNVVLFAGAELPFQNSPARFRVSIGRPEAPFLISSTIFGGGGYLSFVTDTQSGFRSFECSFDYGGVFAFGFGPLSGNGQVTLGLYVRIGATAEDSELGGTFMARGSASIACFGFSTSLFVRLKQQGRGGPVKGEATYTFSFSLGIDDIEFRVRVSSDQGTKMGSQQGTGTASLPSDLLPPFVRVEWAAMTPGKKPASRAPRPPRLKVASRSQRADWTGYRDYFDASLSPCQPI
ncbi:hypothetical protein E4V01_08510 [Methylorubrum sp. Q1]|uniref:hypothetical protein n=1 Tax=Methylorubrum sp. Q1 TaxID=2562453 RepID=UPI0010765739|nr:hypothetical protein [Methylorubrum sp. Q1]TFZ59024.1 hypothetical protein E4V01_08510 [Methylorubrum sp. Q1]